MRFRNGYVYDPAAELVPAMRISPFATSDVAVNKELFDNRDYKHQGRLKSLIGDNFQFTSTGRAALDIALRHYNLHRGDNVWIVTTSGNKYISGCVTSTIEKHCQWSREYTTNTKLILVNHEFGYPFTSWNILDYGLPVIEDMAHSFFSTDGSRTAQTGDFVIYSLPKYFPLQAGGILKCNIGAEYQSDLAQDASWYIDVITDAALEHERWIKARRLQNYRQYEQLFSTINCLPYFELTEGIIPGAFLFNAPQFDLDNKKVQMQRSGIECSVFYGESAFFVPVNQCLSPAHIEFIFSTFKHI